MFDKKGETSYCNNNWGVILLSTPSKAFQIVILQRLNKCIKNLRHDNQCRFCKNRSCTNQLFALRKMVEGCIENSLSTKINFIDFLAAFDSVCRESICQAWTQYALPVKYANIFRAFYTNILSTIQIGKRLRDWIKVPSGTGQVANQIPPLFNITLIWVPEQLQKRQHHKVWITSSIKPTLSWETCF